MIKQLGLTSMAAVTMAATAVAQTGHENADVHLRNNCRLASQIVRTGNPHPHYDWAVAVLPTCDESGAVAIAALWQEVAADSAQLATLVYNARTLEDGRLLDALLGVAENAGRPRLVRLSALSVLVSYFERGGFIGDLATRTPATARECTVGYQGHTGSVQGTVPFPANRRDLILASLNGLAANAPDVVVRTAADCVNSALRSAVGLPVSGRGRLP